MLRLREALAALPAPWIVLANRRASGAEGPPWVRFLVLHPKKGIALVDTASPEAAVAPLEDFLAHTRLPALHPGDLPIVPVRIGVSNLGGVAERLNSALATTAGARGHPNWCDAVIAVLSGAPDLMLARLRRVASAGENALGRSGPAKLQRASLLRIDTLRPDSALLEWPPPRNVWPLAATVSLLLVAIGASHLREYGPSPMHLAASPRPAMAAPQHATADMLPRALLPPRIAPALLPVTQKSPSIPPLATLVLSPPAVVIPQRQAIATPRPNTVATPQPKPATPAWLKDSDDRQRAPQRHKIVPQRPSPSIAVAVSRGATTVSRSGLTAFVGPGTRDNGVIPANLGAVHLASGTTATLDFYGDGLVNIAVSGQTLARTFDPSTGKPLGATAGRSGMPKIGRGSVLVTADVAADAVDNVINTSGVVQARSATKQNGQIVLDGNSGGTVQFVDTNDAQSSLSGGNSVAVGAPGVPSTADTVAPGGVTQSAIVKPSAMTATVGSTATAVSTSIGSVSGAVSAASTSVPEIGGTISTVGSTLTNSVTSLTKPVTSLAPTIR